MNELLAINWIDGMKINKSHFVHNDQLYHQLLSHRSALSLKSYEYGLLPLHASILEKPMVTLEDRRLKIHYCKAINRNGNLIQVNKQDELCYDLSNLDQVSKSERDQFLLIISVDGDLKLPYGQPLESELPPRQPFVKPKYRINMVPDHQVNSEDFAYNFVCLAKVFYTEGSFLLDKDYVPPCHQIISHAGLQERFNFMVDAVSSIEINLTKVIQKARSKKKRGEINDLAESTFYLLEKLALFIAQNINAIRTIYREESPMYLMTFLSGLGKLTFSTLMCLKSEDKEALLRYYESHLGLTPHQFESDMRALSLLEYKPLQATEVFDSAKEHISMLKNFSSKATQLEFHSRERVDVLTEHKVERKKLDIF